MMFKLIKNEEQYEEYLNIAESLINLDPEPGSNKGDKLELLTLLIEKYEDEHYPIDFPDPIEAIKFRMEHQNITQKELASYIGSSSKVSEVLNRKRPLTLKMIRALNKHLNIPAEILLGEEGKTIPTNFKDIDWNKFPIIEMYNKNYFPDFEDTKYKAKVLAEELVRPLLELSKPYLEMIPLNRQHIRSGSEADPYALLVWHAKALAKAVTKPLSTKFKANLINEKFIKDLLSLSRKENGSKLAQNFLKSYGIHLIIEPKLKHTHIDGSVFWNKSENPVIIMTLRYDRLDNFWFTLLHEIGHLQLHLTFEDYDNFVDDLQYFDKLDNLEHEADKFASEALIPPHFWRNDLLTDFNTEKITSLSESIGVHTA
ncbi:MAG: ImmA/IrrE family metallo-endopeptidase, partial [Candidatus Cloacimonetes bacterium]|nr:ImmA/IrrE family metallo-endopeptidase [Candidatus Cloacimonadota bacterium]